MREIKFRAWDEYNKKMFYDVVVYKDMCYLYNNEKFEFLTTSVGYGRIIPMQFTGLKDKNGKEIYEGDIIYDAFGDTVVVKVEEIDFSDYDDECAGFGFILETHSLNDIKKEVEIIGNIYDNPELEEVRDV